MEKVTKTAVAASKITSKSKSRVKATAADRLAVATAPRLLPLENFRSKKLVKGSKR